MAHLKAIRPEMCSYDAGTLNWAGDSIFVNSPKFLMELGKLTMDLGIKPEIEIFDTNMIKNAVRNQQRGFLADPLHFQFVMGTYGGMTATVDNLLFLRNMLPANATFSVSGIGAGSVPMMMAALALGADGIRVGLEDNVYYNAGQLADSNEQFVARVGRLAREMGKELATPDDARAILGLKK
jgi:uncharacterized protein (DUF849 family)